MKRKISFSEVASDKLKSTLIYLENNFSEKIVWRFLKKIDDCLIKIEKFPNSFKY